MSKNFLDFADGNNCKSTDIVVGVRDGAEAQFDFPGDGILDQYGNYYFKYTSAGALSVNYLSIQNSLTGDPVILEPNGVDSTINFTIQSNNGGDLTLLTADSGNVVLDASVTGSVNINTPGGYIDMNSTTAITGVLDEDDMASDSDVHVPTQQSTKAYVDNLAASFTEFTISTHAATTTNFSSTYDNGVAGVGATLTALSNGAAVIDGIAMALDYLVLFKDQTNAYENGVYTVTDVGSVSTPAVYTRFSRYDEASQINFGSVTFAALGTVNKKASFQLIAEVTTVGVDPLNYQQTTFATLSSSIDNSIVRFDSTNGLRVQDSGVVISDLDGVSGVTILDVDNINIDGNTISSTDTNGDVIISPDGVGQIQLNADTTLGGTLFVDTQQIEASAGNVTIVTDGSSAIDLSSPTVLVDTDIAHGGDTNNKITFGTDTQNFQTNGSSRLDINNFGMRLGGAGARINSVSDDTTMAADSSNFGVTQHAVKTYVDNEGYKFPYNNVLGTTTLTSNLGYYVAPIFPGVPVLTLPASPNDGDVIIVVSTSAQFFRLQCNTGQRVAMGGSISAVTGYIEANNQYGSLKVSYYSTSGIWIVESAVGTFDIV